jgi:hypothetical protein
VLHTSLGPTLEEGFAEADRPILERVERFFKEVADEELTSAP